MNVFGLTENCPFYLWQLEENRKPGLRAMTKVIQGLTLVPFWRAEVSPHCKMALTILVFLFFIIIIIIIPTGAQK